MKNLFVIALLLVVFTISTVSTPVNTAGTMDNVPEPQVKPFVQKDVM